MNRKSRSMNLKSPRKVWVWAGASSIALAAVVTTLSTVAVHADARVSRPAATLAPAPGVATPTPTNLAERANPFAQRAAIKRGDRLHGIASWYGGQFNGKKTASGEPYDMEAMTACHPTLPFGSIVRVINRTNGRSVVVRINDRGDLVDQERIIDLSYGAAKRLAMAEAGLAMVDLQVISLGPKEAK